MVLKLKHLSLFSDFENFVALFLVFFSSILLLLSQNAGGIRVGGSCLGLETETISGS